tara:strand:+ start:1509 stop:3035 length:1527 start_codon:yes stop_codon:yes gene_type:complete
MSLLRISLWLTFWAAFSLEGFQSESKAEEKPTSTSQELVKISAIIESVSTDGTSTVLAKPVYAVPVGHWSTFEDMREITYPTAYDLPSIPRKFEKDATGGGTNDRQSSEPNWTTNTKNMVIPSHPTKFEKRDHGLKLKFRPRINSTGGVIVDCIVDQTVFGGFSHEGIPIVMKTQRTHGGKPKEIPLLKNDQRKAVFHSRRQELVFLPTKAGHVSKILSDQVVSGSDSKEGNAKYPQLKVSLSAERLTKQDRPERKTPIPENIAIFVSIKAIECPDLIAPDSMVLSDSELQILIRKLSQQKGVDLMTAPAILLPKGQSGKVEVVREFIYPTHYTAPELLSENSEGTESEEGDIYPVTPATPDQFETYNTGVSIEVIARVLRDKRIELELNPKVTEFEEFVNFGAPIINFDKNKFGKHRQTVMSENRIEMPRFQRHEISTIVQIPDGGSTILGGFIREDIQTVEDKIPILGDLPLIGHLGRSEVEHHIKRYLYFVVTAHLVDNEGNPIE